MLVVNGENVIRNYEASSRGVSFLSLQYAPDWDQKECTTESTTYPYVIDYDGETLTIDHETPGDPESTVVLEPEITEEYQP